VCDWAPAYMQLGAAMAKEPDPPKTRTDILIIDKFNQEMTFDDLRKDGWESPELNDEIVTRMTNSGALCVITTKVVANEKVYLAGVPIRGSRPQMFLHLAEAVYELNQIVASPFLGGWQQDEHT